MANDLRASQSARAKSTIHLCGIDRFHCHAVKKINRKPFSGLSQEIVILLTIDKEDSSPSFRSVRSPKPQIFVEMFRRNLQSPVRKRHVGAHQMCTNMAAGKWCKHLDLTLAI